MSSSAKRQHPHNQNNHNGHSNGCLISAVKRPSRSRSSSNTATPLPVPSQIAPPYEPSPLSQPPLQHHSRDLQEHQLRQLQQSSSDSSSISSAECVAEWGVKTNGTAYGDEDMNMVYSNGLNGLPAGGEHRKIDINPSSDKSKVIGKGTVLSSFPLLDSITLLIIFLQLPSTVLTIIHFLFATMTFVPPSTTLLSASTASSLPSFTTLLLQGSAGSPSILTVIVADILVAIISIFLWPSARTLLIDFAQAVMAISLGAGNTGQTGGTLKNAAVCAGIISGVKVIRNSYEFSDPWFVSPHPPPHNHLTSPVIGFSGISTSWVRNALAVHIVAQGAMRALRGWLIHRPGLGNSDSVASSTAAASAKEGTSIIGKQKDKDPESGAAVSTTTPLSSLSTGLEGVKKKKKQNLIVRSRQPLWAALASTVVHIAKEVEQSQAVSEATYSEDEAFSGSNEHKAHALEGRVWVTNIGSTEINFGAGHFPCTSVEEGGVNEYGDLGHSVNGSGKSDFIPFFVRVNGIAWPQTDLYKPEKEGDVESADAMDRKDEVWAIDITGLTPATEYDIEFVKSKGGQAFYQTSACTMPAQVASSITVPPSLSSSRPLSPVTTLLNTLSQASSTLAEQKFRFKRTKKENNRRLASLRSEIDTLKSRLGSGDKGEERARRRVLSLREFVRRAEEEVEKMTAELEKLENIPDAVEQEWKEKKRLWSEEQKRLEAFESKVEEAKAAADRHASAFETEAASLSSKQERLTMRLAKLNADLEKLKEENTAAQRGKAKKEAERQALVKRRAAVDVEFSEAISKMEKKMQEYRIQSSENWVMAIALENAAALQAQQAASTLPPSTPEGGLPSTRGSLGPVGSTPPISTPLNATIVSTPPGFGPVVPNPTANFSSPRRERASSMFTGENGAPSLSDIIPGERPSLPSLNSFGGFGNGVFDSTIRRSNSQNTRSSFGSIGALNAAPGFERFGIMGKGSGGPGKLIVSGKQH